MNNLKQIIKMKVGKQNGDSPTAFKHNIFFLQSFFAVAALAAVAAADNAPVYRPAYQPAYQPYKPSYQPAYKQPAYEEPAKYQYAYEVQDDYANLRFDANEEREGYNTNGGYSVVLPDGRTQNVAYTVNGYDGYVAEVTYEGEARYDEPAYKPAYKPVYKPVYKPAYAPRYTPAPYQA